MQHAQPRLDQDTQPKKHIFDIGTPQENSMAVYHPVSSSQHLGGPNEPKRVFWSKLPIWVRFSLLSIFDFFFLSFFYNKKFHTNIGPFLEDLLVVFVSLGLSHIT